MKYIATLWLFVLLIGPARSQEPEQVYGMARTHKPISYYKEQAAAWEKMVHAHPQDANAWYNLYYANRVILYNDKDDKRLPGEKNKEVLTLMDRMEAAVPNTYEYNLCRWMAGGFDMTLLPYLEKAAALGKGRPEHVDFMINVAEMTRDISKREYYSEEKFKTGTFSSGIMNYNYNVLVGLDQNAILITAGDNDTYPIWALQARGIRKDVTVINMSLILVDDYRSKLFREMGVAPWDDLSANWNEHRKKVIQHIAANSRNYPVNVALTVVGCEVYTKDIEDKLYLCGLAYSLSETEVDNIAIMKRNMEQRYLLDYLHQHFYNDLSPDVVKEINRNYIVPMLKLYEHYKTSGDQSRALWMAGALETISKGTEDEEGVRKHLSVKG